MAVIRRALFAGLLVLGLGLVVLSVLPAIETNRWFVRMADFPRLQWLFAILAVSVAFAAFIRRAPVAVVAVLVALTLGAIAHAATLWPYRPGGRAFVDSCPDDARLSVLVVNVLMENRTAAPLLDVATREAPDLFLALETDAWWADRLSPLAGTMPYRAEEIGSHHYGIILFSRLPLVRPEVRYFAGQDAPAIVTGVRLRTGEIVGFVGLHPRPPHPSQSSTGRDAQLYAAAFLVRDSDRPTVVAGDLNATPWETSTARMRRIAGLIDPRRGYGYLGTYSVTSWWRLWPLDQVFYEPGFATIALARLAPFGSDHYPYLARLCRSNSLTSPPALRDGDIDEARTAIRAALADAGAR